VSEAWRALKIKQFEHVSAAPSVALLRITGKAPRRRDASPDERPTLLADDGREVARFAALPSPPDDRGVLRAAYSVPAAVIKPETVFSLELADGHVIALPAPVSRAGARPAAPTPAVAPPDTAAAPEPAAADPQPAQADAALRQELADANRRAEEALLEAAAAHDQRAAMEQRNAELAESLRERQSAFDELDVWRQELERRLASMSSELGDATARLRAAEEELNQMRAQPGADGPAEAVEPEPGPPVDLGELQRRAAADAAEVAARELSEAVADVPDPGL
jgi:hypothetical protein